LALALVALAAALLLLVCLLLLLNCLLDKRDIVLHALNSPSNLLVLLCLNHRGGVINDLVVELKLLLGHELSG
jgi:hypothetical protein